MTTPPRLVAFDLDDTLAPSKTAISDRMGALLLQLAERVQVCIISGGQVQQFGFDVIKRKGAVIVGAVQRHRVFGIEQGAAHGARDVEHPGDADGAECL